MVIEFIRPYGRYSIGDKAGFMPEHAETIISKGAAVAVKAAAKVTKVVERTESVTPAPVLTSKPRRKRGR